jgi:integrase
MSKRSRRGTGTMRQRSDGRWEGRYWQLGSHGEWRRSSVQGRDKVDVERQLRAAIVGRDTGAVAPPAGKLSTGDYLKEWLASVEPTVRGRTFDSYSGIVRTHLLPRLARVPMSKLGPLHVQRLHSEMLAAGASPKTVRNVHSLLFSALDRAMRFRLIASNPVALVQPPRLAHREMTALTLTEARAVLAAAESDDLRALWRLAIAAGLRQGELCGLRWGDLDLDAGTVTVAGALEQRTGRKPVRAETKTARSRRTIPLDAATVEALHQHRARAAKAALAAGRSYDLSGWVFRRTRGEGPLSMSIVWKAWRRLALKAGVRLVRFHDLRHTTATVMLAQGIDVRTVADVLGHSDVSTTLRTYVHSTEGASRHAAQVIGEALGG